MNERKLQKVEDSGHHGRSASAVRRIHESHMTVISGSDDLPYESPDLVSRYRERQMPVCTIYCNKHMGGADKKEMYL